MTQNGRTRRRAGRGTSRGTSGALRRIFGTGVGIGDTAGDNGDMNA
jgi:hypothetical protein